jgi:hypothetical protein
MQNIVHKWPALKDVRQITFWATWIENCCYKKWKFHCKFLEYSFLCDQIQCTLSFCLIHAFFSKYFNMNLVCALHENIWNWTIMRKVTFYITDP